MKKWASTYTYYHPMTGNGRSPYPVYSKQKTTWMRFLLFCLIGREYTAVVALQPICVQNHRNPCPRRY